MVLLANVEYNRHKEGIESILKFKDPISKNLLSLSLKRIKDKINYYSFLHKEIDNHRITYFFNEVEDCDILYDYLCESDDNIKRPFGLHEIITDLPLDYTCTLDLKFWWDTKNNIIFWVSDTDFENAFINFLNI